MFPLWVEEAEAEEEEEEEKRNLGTNCVIVAPERQRHWKKG